MAQGIQKIQQQLPFPQQGLSQHFQANELHCIFSQGQELLQKGFCAFGNFSSVTTAKQTLDTTSANQMIRGTELPCFKDKRWFNDFSSFQLPKVVLLSLQAG